MMYWLKPGANEVNFLPWQAQFKKINERRRFWALAIVIIFGAWAIAILAFGYTRYEETKLSLDKFLILTKADLKQAQHQEWARSLPSRKKQRPIDALDRQRNFQAAFVLLQLNDLISQLNKVNQTDADSAINLDHWLWQASSEAKTSSIVFTVSGQDAWQDWWRKAVIVWPSLRIESLTPKDSGWALKASHHSRDVADPKAPPPKLAQKNEIATKTATQDNLAFTLQLTPPVIAESVQLERANPSALLNLVEALNKYPKLSWEHNQTTKVHIDLGANELANFHRIPTSNSLWLQSFEFKKVGLNQWRISINWGPKQGVFSPLRMPLASFSAQINESKSAFKTYVELQALVAQEEPASDSMLLVEPIQSAVNDVNPALHLSFIGYSKMANAEQLSWLKPKDGEKLVFVEIGDLVEGWRVMSAHSQSLVLELDSRQIKLIRSCDALAGVC